jgi:formylglycine-generating enzyme required for sulfatase activity
MKTAKTLFPALFGVLAAFLLLGCLNPVSFNSSSPAEPDSEPAPESGLSDWEPFDVTLTINGDGSVSMAGEDAARAVTGFGIGDIKAAGTGARNYMQLIAAQNGEVTSFSDARQELGIPGAAFQIDVTSGKSYDFLLLMGHWEKEGGGTYKAGVPPTLLAAGLKTHTVQAGNNTVTISMYPIVVETEFTAVGGVKVENPGSGKVFSLIPGNWSAVWKVTRGVTDTNPFDILVNAQKKINGQAALDTLRLKAESAMAAPTLGVGSLNGNVYTLGIGNYALQQTGTAGYANFKLEYVPFGVHGSAAWEKFDSAGKIEGVPLWIIRNGINDLVQDAQTNFGVPNNWGSSANGNGAAPWEIAVKTPGGGSSLTVAVNSNKWPAAAKPEIGFTTGGYTETAAAYYAVVNPDAGPPAGYSAYTQFSGSFAPGGPYTGNQITLADTQTGGKYDVYVIIYKDGAVSAPAKTTITRGANVGVVPTWPDENMILVDGGTFDMGSNVDYYENPIHQVTVSSFYMGKHEVTQKEWKQVMGTGVADLRDNFGLGLPLYGVGDTYPIYYVTWEDAAAYCNALSKKEGLTPAYTISGGVTCNFTASGYRLPTEAEWEYAARGGRNHNSWDFSGSDEEHDVSWSHNNGDSTSHPVELKKANSLGLYDMSGNVTEWCWDWFGVYGSGSQVNPTGPSSGTYRVRRGGSWSDLAREYGGNNVRCTYRDRSIPDYRMDVIGFRVVRPL